MFFREAVTMRFGAPVSTGTPDEVRRDFHGFISFTRQHNHSRRTLQFLVFLLFSMVSLCPKIVSALLPRKSLTRPSPQCFTITAPSDQACHSLGYQCVDWRLQFLEDLDENFFRHRTSSCREVALGYPYCRGYKGPSHCLATPYQVYAAFEMQTTCRF